MKVDRKYYGRWIATTSTGDVVDDAVSYDALIEKLAVLENKDSFFVGHVPVNPEFVGFY